MTHDRAARELSERMSNQKVEGNDGPGFRHVNCPKMLWEELVRLVEGLKVEEGRSVLVEIADACNVCTRDSEGNPFTAEELKAKIISSNRAGWSEYNRERDKRLAAQHLKREQEPAPQPTMEEMGMGDLAWSLAACALKEKWSDAKLGPAIAKFAMDWHAERAAQPPQELEGLRDIIDPLPLLSKWLDGKEKMSRNDLEVLVFALYNESVASGIGLGMKARAALTRGEG